MQRQFKLPKFAKHSDKKLQQMVRIMYILCNTCVTLFSLFFRLGQRQFFCTVVLVHAVRRFGGPAMNRTGANFVVVADMTTKAILENTLYIYHFETVSKACYDVNNTAMPADMSTHAKHMRSTSPVC